MYHLYICFTVNRHFSSFKFGAIKNITDKNIPINIYADFCEHMFL